MACYVHTTELPCTTSRPLSIRCIKVTLRCSCFKTTCCMHSNKKWKASHTGPWLRSCDLLFKFWDPPNISGTAEEANLWFCMQIDLEGYWTKKWKAGHTGPWLRSYDLLFKPHRCMSKHRGRCSESVQSRAEAYVLSEGLWRMRRHGIS